MIVAPPLSTKGRSIVDIYSNFKTISNLFSDGKGAHRGHNLEQNSKTRCNTFYTKTGIEFTYHIRNNYFVLENTNHTITRKQAEEALSIKSDKVSDYSKYQGYAYLWGLLHDSRICGQ